MRTLAAAMRFAERAAEMERVAPGWSRAVCARVLASAKAEHATEDDAAAAACEGEVLRHVTRFGVAISEDLARLRECWARALEKTREGGGPTAGGRKRLQVFDWCTVSWSVRVLSKTPGYTTCQFSGVPTWDAVVAEFGHAETDGAPPIRAHIDRQALDQIVRPIMAYAHFLAHMAQHTHMYDGLTEAQRLEAYHAEFVELRRFVRALTT